MNEAKLEKLIILFSLRRLCMGAAILIPNGIYLFKVNNRNTRTRCEICQCRRSGVFIVSFEHISHLVLVFLLLTLNM